MNAKVLGEFLKYLLEDNEGYFYTLISDQQDIATFEVMLKDKKFQLRRKGFEGSWDEYKTPDTAIIALVDRNISIQRILVELEQAIINKGLFHFMRYQEIQELVGKEAMKEGSEHMAAFANLFKKTINKEIRKSYGKFDLIKQDE
jgi:hypothetical protein